MVLVDVEDLKKGLADLMKRRGVKDWLTTAFDATDIEVMIDITPAVDAAEVVRCKNCKHWGTGDAIETDHGKVCEFAGWLVGANGYCVYGERYDDE